MKQRRTPGIALALAVSCASAAAVLAACTLTQSLEYLQQGGGEGGIVDPDSSSGGDGGREGGGPRPGEVIVPNLSKPDFLAQDATSLYWAAAGTVQSVPKAGGTPRTLGTAAGVTSLAVDPAADGFVFVAAGREVVRFPKSGADAGVVFSAPATTAAVDTVLADDKALFVLQADQLGEASLVRKMGKDGTGQVDLAGDAGLASLMTQDESTLFWMDSTITPSTFYELAKSAAPGTQPNPLAFLVDDDYPLSSREVAADGTNLYWTVENAGNVPLIVSRKRQKSADAIVLYRGTGDGAFGGIALDATFVYALDLKAGSVVRVAKSGTTPGAEVVLDGLSGPRSIVVDATNIYVTIEATGALGAVVKRKK